MAKTHHSLFDTLRYRLKSVQKAFIRFTHAGISTINAILSASWALTVIASAVCIVCLTIHTGYEHSPADIQNIRRALRWIQGIFIVNVLLNIVFRNARNASRKVSWFLWVTDALVLITFLPWVYPHPANPWIPWAEQLLYSNKFLYAILTLYATLTLCHAIIQIIGKRTNPSLLLSGSFLTFIIIGSFLLMLPKCTYGGIDYIDALFVSTSAVCITGLTPIDISVTFTPLGLCVLAFLIQIGALGVMTFTSFFALFFSGNTSIYSQLMLRDIIYSKSMGTLVPTLLYILWFTLAVELVGAVAIFLSIHGTLSLSLADEITFSLFHSLSAFCNAGFSNFPGGMSNPLLLDGNISIYWIMSALIIAGSIGFPILVNFKEAIANKISLTIRRLKQPAIVSVSPHHLFNMNTKIVLTTFAWLFIAGTVVFLFLEYDNSLRGMSAIEKITQAVFNSATPRSAGFSSVNPAGFLNVTLVFVLFLMWIGGASQSTGGGIKVNTFAAIWLNLRAIVTGAPKVTAYHRTIATGSIRRANAVVAISIMSYVVVSLLLLWFEPRLPAKSLLFEANSALFTVGSSLGVTGSLSAKSEILLCVAMFLGRVGIISLLTGVARHRHAAGCSFPSDNIIIN